MRHLQMFENFGSIIAYHNTDQSNLDKIMSSGFQIVKNVRGNHFGNGVYFSDQPNDRWGNCVIKVQLFPTKILNDINDDLKYNDTDLGKAICDFGKHYVKGWPINASEHTDKEFWKQALNGYVKMHDYDMLQTYEFGNKIYVVFDPSIIKIL